MRRLKVERDMVQTADDFLKAYERALNRQDVGEVLELVAEDAVFLFSDGSVHGGREAIGVVLERNFGLIGDEVYAIENVRWLVEGEQAAACVYDFSWSGVIGGKAASGFGRGTTVLRRVGDGWEVVHEHLSKGRFVAGAG